MIPFSTRPRTVRKSNIPHKIIDFIRDLRQKYPRLGKEKIKPINAHIERYNRTIQEEFIDNHLDFIHDKKLFNQALADYLIFYNTKRIHKSLNKKHQISL